MNAALKAPSAKMARKWFGSRNATRNASAMGPAPSTAAIRISRKKPVSRETSVKPPTVRMRSIIPRPGIAIDCSAPARVHPAARDCSRFRGACAHVFGHRLLRAPTRCPAIHQDHAGAVNRQGSLAYDRAPDGVDDPLLGRLCELG